MGTAPGEGGVFAERRQQPRPHPGEIKMSALTRATLAIGAVAVAACSSNSDGPMLNAKPDYIKGAIVSTTYDGSTNDLLTAGLGKTRLQGAAPAAAGPANPTVED